MTAGATALAQRRLAREGGPYTLLLEPGSSLPAGALSGVPLAVKDLFDVAGVPTRAGSAAFADEQPAAADAPVVARLRAAGAAIVGKTALHEVAFGTTGINEYEGTPRNPRDPDRICGGSSSGSAAAVAEGSAALALGTDTGGSVRIPAALCGVVGFKPRFARLSTEGVVPLAPSLDHVGLLARDVATVVAGFAVASPTPVAPAAARPLRTLGLDARALASASEPVAAAVERVLQALAGVELRIVTLPDPQLVLAASTAILFTEAAALHAERLRLDPSRYGADIRERLVIGAALSDTSYEAACTAAAAIRAELTALLEDVDAIVGPTVPIVAPRVDDATGDTALGGVLVEHTRLANLTGVPALSLPVPTDGLPVGLQILGLQDEDVLAVAGELERRLAATA